MRGCKKRGHLSLSTQSVSLIHKASISSCKFFHYTGIERKRGTFHSSPWWVHTFEVRLCQLRISTLHMHSLNVPGGRLHIRVFQSEGETETLHPELCVRERERRRKREDVSRSILVTLPLWHSLCRELDCKIENTGLRWKWWKCLFKMKRLLLGGLYITYNLPSYPLWGPLKSAKHANIAVKLNLICRQIKPFLRVLPLSFICFWAKETHGTFKCTWL